MQTAMVAEARQQVKRFGKKVSMLREPLLIVFPISVVASQRLSFMIGRNEKRPVLRRVKQSICRYRCASLDDPK